MTVIDVTLQRQLTLGYIATDPTVIVLIPETKTKLANGGQSIVDGTPRTAQTFKLIAMQYNQDATPATTGDERIWNYTLMGAYDAVVAVGDHWAMGGRVYRVTMLEPGYDYMVKALVEARG